MNTRRGEVHHGVGRRDKLGGVELRSVLDKYLWTERDHVAMVQLYEWFARAVGAPQPTRTARARTEW